MKIKEVEKRVGITSANIRYYEKEGLLEPVRNKENNYREYSEEDVERLNRIKVLRMLGVSLADIKELDNGSVSLEAVMKKRLEQVHAEAKSLQEIERVCETIIRRDMGIEALDEQVLGEDKGIWKERLAEILNQDTTKEMLTRKQLNRNIGGMLAGGFLLNVLMALLTGNYFMTYQAESIGRSTQEVNRMQEMGLYTPYNAFVTKYLVIFMVIVIVSAIVVYFSASMKVQVGIFFVNSLILTPLLLSIVHMIGNGIMEEIPEGITAGQVAGFWCMVVIYILILLFLSEIWEGMFTKVRYTLVIVVLAAGIMTVISNLVCGKLVIPGIASLLITLYIGMNWTTANMDQDEYNRFYAIVTSNRMINIVGMFIHMKGHTSIWNYRR